MHCSCVPGLSTSQFCHWAIPEAGSKQEDEQDVNQAVHRDKPVNTKAKLKYIAQFANYCVANYHLGCSTSLMSWWKDQIPGNEPKKDPLLRETLFAENLRRGDQGRDHLFVPVHLGILPAAKPSGPRMVRVVVLVVGGAVCQKTQYSFLL